MSRAKVAVLTSGSSWFMPYAVRMREMLSEKGYSAGLFSDHEKIPEGYNIVFILSYFRLIPGEFLGRHEHNIVVHESDLPRGRGWAPFFWQVLEGKKSIPVSLFEASAGADDGPVYFKDTIELEGHELNAELREKQAAKSMEMCFRFLEELGKLAPGEQEGEPTFYAKRGPEDSRLDPDRTIREQFGLIRTAHNEDYPLFFEVEGHRYYLSVKKGGVEDEKGKSNS